MPNLRPTELIIILLIILLLFGAKKLPDLARGIGESLTVFRQAAKSADEDNAAPAATTPAPAQPVAQVTAAPAPAPVAQPAATPATATAAPATATAGAPLQ